MPLVLVFIALIAAAALYKPAAALTLPTSATTARGAPAPWLPAPAAGAQKLGLDGFSETQFLPVEEAYQLALEVIDERQLRLYWQISEGYYLYRQHFSFSLEDAAGTVELAAQMPPGRSKEDAYFGLSEVYYHTADIYLDLARNAGPATLRVSSQGCADAGLCYPPQRQQFAVDFVQKTIAVAAASSAGASTAPPGIAPASAATGTKAALLSMLLLAFLGGSLLNLMPCVFPVLSLKLLSFAGHHQPADRVVARKRRQGWAYAAGVVSSFLLVALLLIALQQVGAAVGWGFQLQSPRFVALLAYLFFSMGLALSGLIELGAGLMGTGSRLANRGGYSGSFFTGVLATVVASPCTAPFMGTALGFALTQPAPIALAIFAALGSGMAAPMLLLSYTNTLHALLPKPGAWMVRCKQLLAFPLYATAIWLLWVSGRQTSVTTMALLLCGMLALALGLWLWRYRPWGRLLGAGAILAALSLLPTAALDPGSGAAAGRHSVPVETQLAALLATGRPVLVNVTADWCITCIANERGALNSARVKQALTERQVAYLVLDWTLYDPDIANFLARFGRNGIPLYLLYSGQAGAAPQILPQLLTPGIIVDALQTL